MNRVICAKAQIAIAANKPVTLQTEEGSFEITPRLARKLLRDQKKNF